jgi:hypothetical protein
MLDKVPFGYTSQNPSKFLTRVVVWGVSFTQIFLLGMDRVYDYLL